MFSPLEQFRITNIYTLWYLPLTNIIIITFLSFFFFKILTDVNKTGQETIYLLTVNIYNFFFTCFLMVRNLVKDNLKGILANEILAFITTLFFFILFANLIGMIPYSFTITSHLILTFSIGISIYTAIQFLYAKHGLQFFALFYPSGINLTLAFLLIPIELVSFLFKPISLSVRLFANLMAGHTLLKVIAGFTVTLSSISSILFLAHYFSVFILIAILGLETGVAFIQAYVYTILSCIYISESIDISH